MFQPFAFAGGAGVAVTASGVCSTLKEMLVDAEFPALSVAEPLNDWFAPSVVTLMAVGQLAVPERASVQANVTVAGSFTTPLTAAGVTEAVIPGCVLSMFRVTEAAA